MHMRQISTIATSCGGVDTFEDQINSSGNSNSKKNLQTQVMQSILHFFCSNQGAQLLEQLPKEIFTFYISRLKPLKSFLFLKEYFWQFLFWVV